MKTITIFYDKAHDFSAKYLEDVFIGICED